VFRWFLCAACLLSVAACRQASVQPKDDVTIPALPREFAGWTAVGEGEIYDTESIFAYIDGHAEVYLAYGMKRCVSRRYEGPGDGGEIVVDLFEMASPADAFGVFSHDRAGDVAEVGQGGVFRFGWLSFWKGSWYGSVTSMGGDDGVRDAVLALGRAAAEDLPGEGHVPELVSRLPADGLDSETVCFLRSPQILNAHVFVGDDDPFGLGGGAEAVVGAYELDGAAVHLVVIRYEDEADAEAAERALSAAGQGETGRPPMTIGRHGPVIAAVVGAPRGELSESLLVEALGGKE